MTRRPWLGRLAGAILAAMALVPATALAASALEWRIAPGLVSDALIQIGLKAGVTIGGASPGACGALARPVSGRMTLTGVLKTVLRNSPCDFRMVDAKTVRIVLRPRRPAERPPPFIPKADVGPDPSAMVADVVVTATRRPESRDLSPYGVSSLDGAELSDAGAHGLNDISGLVGGMTVTNLGAGRDKILLRGLSDGALTGHTQSTVGIYLDDVRVTYNAPDPDLRLADMERVEVLRGPQGQLYGAGSIGGIVHLVTHQPDLDRWSGSVSAETDATRGGAGGSTLEGVLNAPLVPGRAAIRLVAYREVDGGYMEDVSLGLDRVNRTVRSGERAALRLDLDPLWRVTVGFARQAISAADTQYAVAGLGPYQRGILLQEPHDNDFLQAYLRLEGDLPWGRLKWSTSYINHQLDSRYDATAALPGFAPGLTGIAAYDDSLQVRTLVNEATLSAAPGRRLDWLFGGFAAFGGERLAPALTALSPGGPTQNVFAEARSDAIDEFAIYGEASYPVTPRLQITAGARWFLHWQSVRATERQPLFGLSTGFTGQASDTGVAPKLVVRYQFADNAVAYVQAAEGYRAGGFNSTGPVGQVFSSPGQGPEPYRRFLPDELWSYEAGVRASAFNGRLRLRAAGYFAVWTDIQSDQLLPNGLPFTANIGDGDIRGVEGEAAYANGGLTVTANLLLDDPELVRGNPAFPARPDHSLPGVPKSSAGLSAVYDRAVADGLDLRLGARVAYVGASRLTFDAATAPLTEAYWTGRISARLASPRWSLEAFVDNPANSAANTFPYGNPFTLRLMEQTTPLRPRTFGLKLTRNF